MQSLSFDRAVDYYDQTRGLPAQVSELVGNTVAQRLPVQARVLEVGIGTGRIAKPMVASGLHVTGIDVSRRMMQRLLHTLRPGMPVPSLAEADATHLPLRSAVFDAIVGVHVFHLIGDWRLALDEVRRTLKPGGVLLIGYESYQPDSPAQRIRSQWQKYVAARGVDIEPRRAGQFEDVKTALLESGAMMDEWPAATWVTHHTVRKEIEHIEQRLWSSTWRVPDEVFPATIADLWAWAQDEFGTMDTAYDVEEHFVWQRFSWGE